MSAYYQVSAVVKADGSLYMGRGAETVQADSAAAAVAQIEAKFAGLAKFSAGAVEVTARRLSVLDTTTLADGRHPIGADYEYYVDAAGKLQVMPRVHGYSEAEWFVVVGVSPAVEMLGHSLPASRTVELVIA